MDRRLPIAIGSRSGARFWKNETRTWSEIVNELSTTTYTKETAEEYANFSQNDRSAAKDHGGFVGGQLKDNRRLISNVLCRSVIALDVDSAELGIFNKLEKEVKYTGAAYTTHSHRPEKPRLRIAFPLTRDVSVDEFVAISRYLADEIGIDQVDPCSFRPNQLMYWPTTSKGAEFRFLEFGEEWLDPDMFLKDHPNWRDISTLPTSSREKPLKKVGRKQEDPTMKKGPVGAFCRAYFPIDSAIEKFLSDVYEKCVVDSRYTYIDGEASAGLVIYDDRFAYSHHATDPAYGLLLNAYDLVRIHMFGYMDDEGDSKNSTRAMNDLVSEDVEVQKLMAKEAYDRAGEDFEIITPDKSKEDSKEEAKKDTNWVAKMEVHKKTGEFKDTINNFVLILDNDPALKGICYNELTCCIDVMDGSELPWERGKVGWTDSDMDSLAGYIEKRYRPMYSPSKMKQALSISSMKRKFHPIKVYIESVTWDGVPRLDTLFIVYLGAPDTDYTKAVTRKTFTAAVKRVFEPGCKFDQMLVLNGPQGIGKSTILSILGGKWFCDTLTLQDMRDKTGSEKLVGYMILEVGELAGIRKAEVESIKSFMSRTDDKYRPAYAINVESHPRQCIIIGTTNAEQGYLRDVTGNRRFWPVKLSGKAKKSVWSIDEDTVHQLWAEAYHYYREGEQLYLSGELLEEAENQQRNAMESDDAEGLVEEYVNMPLPSSWDSMSTFERKSYFEEYMQGKHDDVDEKTTTERVTVSNMEIWYECFGRQDSIDRVGQNRIAAIVQRIPSWADSGTGKFGFHKKTQYIPLYGKQRVYEKNPKFRRCSNPSSNTDEGKNLQFSSSN